LVIENLRGVLLRRVSVRVGVRDRFIIDFIIYLRGGELVIIKDAINGIIRV
jgi:hypothetical protein